MLLVHSVFFLAKPDPDIYDKIVKSIQFLTSQDVSVVVEHDLYTALPFLHTNPSVSVFNPQSLGNKRHPFDFIVTFGGDGLLLHVNTLFADRAIPPVMSFYFGSLGFLCPFAYEDFEKEV
jgi:NAD kinase